MEGDPSQCDSAGESQNHFNPLPPHGGRQYAQVAVTIRRSYFNPLPPHGGRLVILHKHSRRTGHFNPLPPHGGRPRLGLGYRCVDAISIHSLRMEGDAASSGAPSARRSFQSTPSAWRETEKLPSVNNSEIHFNPLPPHGGRQEVSAWRIKQIINFNPLPPHGGRPALGRTINLSICISIHSLRMEGDI